MFDGVARRYDIVNNILSLGRTKAWRKAATKIIAPAPGMKILDMAAGTGSSSAPLAAAGADVTAADFSQGMIAAGQKARPDLTFIKADAPTSPLKITPLTSLLSLSAFAIPRTPPKRWPRPAESLNLADA